MCSGFCVWRGLEASGDAGAVGVIAVVKAALATADWLMGGIASPPALHRSVFTAPEHYGLGTYLAHSAHCIFCVCAILSACNGMCYSAIILQSS